jgi:biopolymer transport protein ExbD
MQEAINFCNVYDPEDWRNFKNTGLYFEFQDELVKRISKIVVTAEFRNIFEKLAEDDSRPYPYTFYKTEIEKLTGEKWNCPHAKDFYSVQWKSEPSTSRQATSEASDIDELIIRLEQNGDYVINSKKVAAQNSEKIDQLLRELITSTPKVKVISADGVSKEQLLDALQKLSQLRVTNVSVVTQGYNPPKLD